MSSSRTNFVMCEVICDVMRDIIVAYILTAIIYEDDTTKMQGGEDRMP